MRGELLGKTSTEGASREWGVGEGYLTRETKEVEETGKTVRFQGSKIFREQRWVTVAAKSEQDGTSHLMDCRVVVATLVEISLSFAVRRGQMGAG